jgi:hypothetical protein
MSRLRRRFARITDRFAGRGHALAIQYRPASIEVTDSGVFYPNEGHGWHALATNEDFWGRVERFLGKHIGAAAQPAP